MKIKYLGHACLSIEVNEKQLLIDPFISGNELAKDIDIKNFKNYIMNSLTKQKKE